MKWLRNSRGFTLIEMVLIIVILGVLAAVAIPQFVALQDDADAANNIAYVGALRSALGMRFGEQLLRTGNTAPAGTDVIGTVADADAPAAYMEGRVTSVKPATLTTTAGICGTGEWAGLQPGNPPANGTWTLDCGATASDPLTIGGP